MVEQSAVNRSVVGSSPTSGAILQHIDCKWLKLPYPPQNTPSARETASVPPVFEGLNILIVPNPSVLHQYTLTLDDLSLLSCSKMKEAYEDTLLALPSWKDLLPPR